MEEQEQKPNIVYGFEVRQYERTGNYPQFGRTYFYLTCPFCQRELKVYPWSLAGSGRNWACGMKHKTFSDVYHEVWKHQSRGLTLREISAIYPGVSHGTIARILKGTEPKRPDIRHALGMTVYQPAPACPIHGVVHVGRCPREVAYRRLSDMPPDLLRWKLENRERII